MKLDTIRVPYLGPGYVPKLRPSPKSAVLGQLNAELNKIIKYSSPAD